MSKICVRCRVDLLNIKYEADGVECRDCRAKESRKSVTQRRELGVVFKIPLEDGSGTFEERARRRALEAL